MRTLRFATIEEDGWELESGEAYHAAAPNDFHIPPRDLREALSIGDAAKLLFDIEYEGESGLERIVERMWVIVRERFGDFYVGVLDSAPCSVVRDPGVLARGSEIVFEPEHIIDFALPPGEDLPEH